MGFFKWTAFSILAVGALLSGGVMVAGLSMAGSKDLAAERTLQSKQAALVLSSEPAHLYLTIAVGVGQDNPAYVPSDFSVPRNSLVEITITNFDDATPLTGDAVKYAKVTGTVGDTATVTPIDLSDPNGAANGPVQKVSSIDPNDVSHTFTVPQLGLNVPIWPHARTTFLIRTGKAGSYFWACLDPCGGAMSAPRYMSGTLRVV